MDCHSNLDFWFRARGLRSRYIALKSLVLEENKQLTTCATGVMSGVITAPLWLAEFPRVNHNATLLGFTVAIYDIGTMLGAVSMIFLGDRLGRKRSCLLGGAGVIIGVVIQVTAMPSSSIDGRFAQFLIGRTITGWGNGINMASMPVWQSELSHASRGMLVCLSTGLIATGTMFSYWLVKLS